MCDDCDHSSDFRFVNMAHPPAVGIDLGTTNSAAAWVDASGRSQLVRNAEGDLLTPSVVLFDDDEVIVGKEARGALAVDPGVVAQWVKRDMGSAVYSRAIHGEFLPPEVIQACILRKLKRDLVESVGPDFQAVITVPAYFDEPRRKATSDAGEMAGLSVLDIVNEPTAAALAFAETLGYLAPEGAVHQELTVLVFDLGGGTFDTTLLRLAPGDIKTLATDGDVQLGGYDWDRMLVDDLAETFQKAHGSDPRENPASLNRLFQSVAEAKHTLSARGRAKVAVADRGKEAQIEITRDRFEELTAGLLERTAYTTRQLATAARIEWQQVDRVLLVGGSTRMPMVGRMLEELTGRAPDRTVNPDEAVARGAALYAAYLLAKRSKKASFEVTNVNAHSLGVEGIDQETLRKKSVVLIPRNSPLPAVATERFVTQKDGQRSIVVRIIEGESSLPAECTPIGRMVVPDLPEGLPKGWPIEVTFRYAANGRLDVRAKVPGTEQEAALKLERATGLSRERVDKWKDPIAADAGFGAFEALIDDVLRGRDEDPSDQIDNTESEEDEHDSGAEPLEPDSSAPPAINSPPPSRRRGRSSTGRAIFLVVGYLTSAVVGLGGGYLILHWLKPISFPLPW